MTDCSSIHGSTSSSSDVLSSRGGGGVMSPRIRIVRLVRPSSKRVLLGPESSASFGFALRGGKEFGSGFFVSRVDKGSEADAKGLRVGDQIIRVNGYLVDDAIHKELAQFISNQDRITLKVRGVGMLPVKEKPADLLTWHIVPHHALTSITDLEDLPPAKEIRVVLKVAPRTKLGLGICKGPEWKPGIYVQFTKDFSVARDAGLRPGDQILSCNSIDFSDVLFSEAVAVMKSSHTLEMVIRPGAGLDLFPGESSGYNSSASSVTGDQSPCWGDQSAKRLSIVREENAPSHQRSCADKSNLDRRKDGIAETIYEEGPKAKSESNRTIIKLSGTGTVINSTLISNNNTSVHLQSGLDNVTIKQNNISSSSSNANTTGHSNNNAGPNVGASNEQSFIMAGDAGDVHNSDAAAASKTNSKIADICFVSRQSETKTVIVEVHRSAPTGSAEEKQFPDEKTIGEEAPASATPQPPPPMPPPAFQFSHDTLERCLSTASSTVSGVSLSNAISEELRKRQVRRTVSHDPNQNYDSTNLNGSGEKLQPKRIGNPSLGGVGAEDEKRHNALMDEFKRAHRKMFRNGFQETEKEVSEERQDELNKAVVMRDEVDRAPSSHIKTENHIPSFPTPPPPPQFANGYNDNSNNNQTLMKRPVLKQDSVDQPPSSPTPDYDTTPTNTLPKTNGIHREPTYANGNINSTLRRVAANSEAVKANGEAAELESIESFKLKNPSSPIPRPPSLYFAPQNSGPPTMKKITRPVSVTIGEYGGCNGRKEPGKFDFIAKSTENGSNGNCSSFKEDNVSEMLRTELEKTLSRSNLKKVNETHNIVNGETPNCVANGNEKLPLQKTNVQRLASILQNKQQNGTDSTVNGTPATNGILKNGFGKAVANGSTEKNITFGN